MGLAITAVLGEWLCLQREMRDIVVGAMRMLEAGDNGVTGSNIRMCNICPWGLLVRSAKPLLLTCMLPCVWQGQAGAGEAAAAAAPQRWCPSAGVPCPARA